MDGGDVVCSQIASQCRNGEGFQAVHIGEVEQNPAACHCQKSVDPLNEYGDLFVEAEENLLFNDQ